MLPICLAEPAEMDEFCQIQYRAVRNYKNQQQKRTTPKQHGGETVMHCAIRALAFLLLPCLSWPAEEM